MGYEFFLPGRDRSLINAAGFPKPYDFSQFRDDEVEFQSDCSIKSLKSLDFKKEGKNLIMYGRDRHRQNDVVNLYWDRTVRE